MPKKQHLPFAPMSLERTSELPPLYTAESSKVPLWDPMLRRPVSLFTWNIIFSLRHFEEHRLYNATWRSTVPSAKKVGFLASTKVKLKYDCQGRPAYGASGKFNRKSMT